MIIKVYKIILRGVWKLSKTQSFLLFKSEIAEFLVWTHVLFIDQQNIYCSVTETKL